MKRYFQIVSMLLMIGIISCNFSKGVKKDFSTGLTTSYNGFAIDDIYLTANGNKLGDNKINLGDKVEIVVTGVRNYTIKDDRVFPACTIVLKDKSGKELLNLADAFADRTNGFARNEAETLTASISTGDPMVKGEAYHFSARFTDKNNPESVINTEVNIIAK